MYVRIPCICSYNLVLPMCVQMDRKQYLNNPKWVAECNAHTMYVWELTLPEVEEG